MHWTRPIADVFVFYIQLVFVVFFYMISADFAKKKDNPTTLEKVWQYAKGIGIVSLIGLWFSHRGGDEDNPSHWEFETGLHFFLLLVIPVIFGIAEGFRKRPTAVNPGETRGDARDYGELPDADGDGDG
jgi:hypothetical protein